MVYHLHRFNKGSNILHPSNVFCTEEYAEGKFSLYLTEVFHRDEEGTVHKYYRLHARDPHSIEDALAYDIKCPECGDQNTLKQIGRVLNWNKLGLYKCPCCDAQRTKRRK